MTKRFATLLLTILLIPAISAFAQDNGAPGGPPNDNGPGGPPDFSQMRQRMEAALKQRLGVTDDEWAVLSPKIQKVRQLQMQLRPPRPDFGPRNGPPGAEQNTNNNQDQNSPPPPPGNPNDQSGPPGGGPPDMNQQGPGGPPEMANSPIQKALDHLNQLLRSTDSSDSEIQAACDAVRKARADAKSDLAKAQDDLKSVVTPRQEAVLLAMGILE
jgi:Spy/CpxP family protein refolding chaperone